MDDKKIVEAVNKWPWTMPIFPVSTLSNRAARKVTLLTNADDVSLYTAGLDPKHPYCELVYEIIEDADGTDDVAKHVASIERQLREG